MKLSEATYFPDANELTRHGFVSHMEDFIGKLLGNNPLGADVDDYLKGFDNEAKSALDMLTRPEIEGCPESAVVIRTEKIKNGGTDEFGKPMKDEFQVIYKVPKRDSERGIKGLDEKLRNLYIKLFENHIVEGTVLNEDGEGGGAFGDMGGNGGFISGGGSPGAAGGEYEANALGRKKSGKQDEEKSTDFPVLSREIFKVTESKKKMKAPIGRTTMYITEEQLRQLAKILKEEAVTDTKIGGFGYDAPGLVTKNKDFLKVANDREDMLSRKNPDNQPVGEANLEEGSGIHIKKKNEGKFTATKKRTGKSTEELTHSKNPLTRKRAIFAQNAKKWSHKKDE